MSFAGSDIVRIGLKSFFPVTVANPLPSSNEPMAFVDELMVYDYCYEPTPTPTATPPLPRPIPATSRHGVIFVVLLISAMMIVPILRRS